MDEEVICKAGGKRAIRRHHRERIKKARAGHWGYFDKTPRQLGLLVNTAALCSCWMCRNERVLRGHGPFQERKQLAIDMFEDLESLDD